MQSKAKTVAQYLASLPADRRAAISAVRDVILANLDRDYEEGMQYGMIGYAVPLHVFPAGYHCAPGQPLPVAALGAQKNYMTLHMMALYMGTVGGGAGTQGGKAYLDWFQSAWARTGKKLDMGKACIRFKKLEDIPLDVIGEAIRRVPAKKYIAVYEASLAGARSLSAARKAAKAPNGASRAKAPKTAGKAVPRTRASAKTTARPVAKKRIVSSRRAAASSKRS